MFVADGGVVDVSVGVMPGGKVGVNVGVTPGARVGVVVAFAPVTEVGAFGKGVFALLPVDVPPEFPPV